MFSRILSAALVTLFSLNAAVVAIPAYVNPLHGIGRRDTHSLCGNELTSDAVDQMERAFASALQNQGSNGVTAAGSFVVPVVFQVISAGDDISQGNVPDSQLQAQIDVFNREFSGTGLSFQLQRTVRTLNEDWFDNAAPGNQQQTDMKNALRQGGVNTLNVYTVSFENTGGLLGYATFPANYTDNPKDDGIVLRYSTVPGGSETGYNTGRILVHETGHWVGLYHTFQGGCLGNGDEVDDTPAEAFPASGCPKFSDTCPLMPGQDPVHNHMDYSDDSCRDNFTPGQIARLKDQLRAFRQINL